MFTVTINRCQETILKNSNKVSILVSIFLFAPLVSHVLHKLRIRISANRSFNEVLQLHFSHPLNASCFLRILRIWCVLSIFMFQRILPTSLKQNSYLCSMYVSTNIHIRFISYSKKKLCVCNAVCWDRRIGGNSLSLMMHRRLTWGKKRNFLGSITVS